MLVHVTGQCFEYYSGTSLTTPFGYMHGEFEFTNRKSIAALDGRVPGYLRSCLCVCVSRVCVRMPAEDNSRFKAKVDRTLLSGSSTSNTTDPDTK